MDRTYYRDRPIWCVRVSSKTYWHKARGWQRMDAYKSRWHFAHYRRIGPMALYGVACDEPGFMEPFEHYIGITWGWRVREMVERTLYGKEPAWYDYASAAIAFTLVLAGIVWGLIALLVLPGLNPI